MARILFHTLIFPPDGVSTAYLLGDLAAELVRRGHEVEVLTTTPHYNVEASALQRQPIRKTRRSWLMRSEFGEIPVWHIRTREKRGGIASRLVDFIRFHLLSIVSAFSVLRSYDVVFSPSPPMTMGIVGWLLSKRFGARSIYNVQEIYPDFAVNQGLIRNRLIIGVLRLLERLTYRISDSVVVISKGFASTLSTRTESRKITMIPNFCNLKEIRPGARSNEFSKGHGLENSFVVLYAGNIGLSHDWQLLVNAAKAMENHPVKFIVVGGGAGLETLEILIADVRPANLELLPYQPKSKVPDMYAAADLAVIPMKAKAGVDTFPSKVLTIMAAARPVLASVEEDSDMAQLVREAGAGWLVTPGDLQQFVSSLREALEQPEEARRRGEAGYRHVESRYSLSVVGGEYDRLIAALQK